MKAILVIDMPEACADGCPVMCRTRGINHRPTWCPLKPLPEKVVVDMSESHEAYYQIGWNECIEELEK